jgi:chondroitin sulfate synthase
MSKLRSKCIDLLKILFAVAFGYILKATTGPLSDIRCILSCPTYQPNPQQQCPVCMACSQRVELVSSSPCPLSGKGEEPLKTSFKPKTVYDVLRYDYFNKSQIFNNFDDDPRIWLLHHQSDDVKDLVSQVTALYNKASPIKNWRFGQLLNGYRRFDPLRGEEYILDIELVTVLKVNKRHQTVTNSIRFEAVKPFANLRLLSNTLYSNQQTIYFVLPLTQFGERFRKFVQNLIDAGWSKSGESVCLLIVWFTTKGSELEVDGLKQFIIDVQRSHPQANIQLMEAAGEFSRGLGLDLASLQLRNDSLLFFCDVDVTFTHAFLQRCRLNSIRGHQVYYPMVFAQYKSSLVHRHAPSGVNDNEINKYTGYWVYYGYGMACMYNEDYRRVGGFDLSIRGWGGEDVDLYTKHVKSDLKVIVRGRTVARKCLIYSAVHYHKFSFILADFYFGL